MTTKPELQEDTERNSTYSSEDKHIQEATEKSKQHQDDK